MIKTPLQHAPLFPAKILRLVKGAALFDSSCGAAARVYYADNGLYVKEGAAGSLAHEAQMAQLFHQKGLGPEVVSYVAGEKDYLVSRAAKGQDLTHHLDKPLLLCARMAEMLRQLHSFSGDGLPESPSMALYRAGNGNENQFEKYVLMEHFPIASREEAKALADAARPLLKTDVWIHGDACLPNMMMEGDRITAFIDFSTAGAGDRHIDLFWAVWSLGFNLKTEKYTRVFLDAYGADAADREMIRAVSAMEAVG